MHIHRKAFFFPETSSTQLALFAERMPDCLIGQWIALIRSARL